MTRLDRFLVDQGYFESRQKAQDAIEAGLVEVDGRVADKPSRSVGPGNEVIVNPGADYVGRGALKLAHGLDAFGVDVEGLVMLDAGASTGGFTQCLLTRGARRVYAVDVGHGQLDERLRADPRVVSMEGTDIRDAVLPEMADGAVVDVSFIPLGLVVPPIMELIAKNGFVIALVKPQFEAGRVHVGKGGLVRDPAVHVRVLHEVMASFRAVGMEVTGLIPSPIRGRGGNREYLLYARKGGEGLGGSYDIEDVVALSFAREQ